MAVCVLLARECMHLPDGKLHVHVLDVGQGDATLLVSPSGKQVLIDGGPDNSALVEAGRHMSFFDRSIDLLVLTHPDLDHLAAFPEFLERYRISKILMTREEEGGAQYRRFLSLVASHGTEVIIADPKRDIDLGDGVTLDIIWPPEHLSHMEMSETNNRSIVLRALHGSAAILLSGDIEEKAEHAILRSGADLRSDYLKVSHHGSKTSTSTGFLLATDPDIALISAGKDNRFGHPHQTTVDRLHSMGIAIRSTASDGEISLVLP